MYYYGLLFNRLIVLENSANISGINGLSDFMIRAAWFITPSSSLTEAETNVNDSLFKYVENQYRKSLLLMACFVSPVSHIYNNTFSLSVKKASTIDIIVSFTFGSLGDFLLFELIITNW